MRIKLTREMIKRIYDSSNKKGFGYYPIDDSHLIVMIDRALLMVVDASDDWNDLISGLNIDTDDRLPNLIETLPVSMKYNMVNGDKLDNSSFIKKCTYYKLTLDDTVYLFDEKYMRYFIKKNYLSYDLFSSGRIFGLIIYEGSDEDYYNIVGIVMGVNDNG